MKKLITAVSITLLTLTSANAMDKCGAGKCGASMSTNKSTTALHQMHSVDGYDVGVSSEKSLIVGNNELLVTLHKDGKKVDAKVKVKFFMPQMPGMPYMESKNKGKTTDGTYKSKINFSMSGTWQYQLKFKTEDKKVHKVKGSVNL